MIFQRTWQQVLDGSKTQTRRLVKDSNHIPVYCEGSTTQIAGVGRWAPLSSEQWVIYHWSVGHTYAVQPGRGKGGIWYKHTPAGLSVWDETSLPRDRRPRNIKPLLTGEGWDEARIRITGIRQEDVREISINDVRREGFRSKYEFLETWTMMHDQAAYNACPDGTWHETPLAQQQKAWRDWLQGQIADHYQAWVLEFELVREAMTA